EKSGWIEKNAIATPLLAHYIKATLPENILLIKKNTIYINGIPLVKEFSSTEQKLLQYFLSQQGEVISRDTLGDVIWGEESEDKFSEWAIDQHISRLRKKLKRMGIGISIKTVKGRGYIYV